MPWIPKMFRCTIRGCCAAADWETRPRAEREEKLFRRFKAEEASQALTARRRASSPEDNNERQSIHDHESAVQ